MGPLINVVVREASHGLPIARALVSMNGREGVIVEVRTGADGKASFLAADLPGGCFDGEVPRLTLADDRGRELGTCPLPSLPSSTVELSISGQSLSETSLRVGLGSNSALDAVLAPLYRAVDALGETSKPQALLALERLRCFMPPLLQIPGIVELARSVLLGRTDDLVQFQDELERMKAWNVQHVRAASTRTSQQAMSELKARSFRAENQAPHLPRSAARALLNAADLTVLTFAAGYAGGVDPARALTNIDTVGLQVGVLGQLDPLLRAAMAVGNEPARFERLLWGYAGFCPPGFSPPGVGVPGAPTPGTPRPGRGLPDTPGHDGPPGFPVPGPELPDIREECPELIAAVREAVAAGSLRFRIVDMQPPRACPGAELVFTIEWLGESVPTLPDVDTMVGFRGLGAEAARIVRARWLSEHQFSVRVPSLALCGPLEVSIPTLAPRFVCEVNIGAVYAQARDAVYFEGGLTYVRTLSASSGSCLGTLDEVTLSWDHCNADYIDVSMTFYNYPSGGGASAETQVQRLPGSARTFVLRIPEHPRYASVAITVAAVGPCGRHERAYRAGIMGSPLAPSPWTNPDTFENWHGNIRYSGVGIYRPTTLEQLVSAVRSAGMRSPGPARAGVTGSRWSYSRCVAGTDTRTIIDIAALNQRPPSVLPHARGEFRSVFNERTRTLLDRVGRVDVTVEAADTSPSMLADAARLVHIQAGINLIDLNSLLDSSDPPLAMATLGGSNGQTLAGAINTSTHGANADMPPISDIVRAIHLVGPGGKQWWLEPDELRVTSETRMRELMARGVLDPCLELRYDNALFDAALVSMGTAGVVYAYVLEVVPRHVLEQVTVLMSWPDTQTLIRDQVTSPSDEREWVLEVSTNPSSDRCWVTTRTPSPLPVDAASPPAATLPRVDPLTAAIFGALFGGAALPLAAGLAGGALGFVFSGFSVYFARRSAELVRIVTNPFEWFRIGEVIDEIRLVEDIFGSLQGIIEVIQRAASGGSEDEVQTALADVMPELLSILWRIGFFGISGRHIIDIIQNLFTNIDQRPPGTTRAKSYQIMTGQGDCTSPRYQDPSHKPPARHPPLIRLIHSQEYVIDAEQLVAFTDEVLAVARRIRREQALILVINLRFTRQTRASLGIQQHPLSGHVELWTIRDMPGNAAFFAEVQELVNRFGAIPHWGHVHEPQDLTGRYRRHAEWERAINTLAQGGEVPNLFRDEFAFSRGILSEL